MGVSSILVMYIFVFGLRPLYALLYVVHKNPLQVRCRWRRGRSHLGGRDGAMSAWSPAE